MQLHTLTLPFVENILQSAMGCGKSKFDYVTQVPPEYLVWVISLMSLISLQVTYKQLHCFQNSNQVFHRGADFGNQSVLVSFDDSFVTFEQSFTVR